MNYLQQNPFITFQFHERYFTNQTEPLMVSINTGIKLYCAYTHMRNIEERVYSANYKSWMKLCYDQLVPNIKEVQLQCHNEDRVTQDIIDILKTNIKLSNRQTSDKIYAMLITLVNGLWLSMMTFAATTCTPSAATFTKSSTNLVATSGLIQ